MALGWLGMRRKLKARGRAESSYVGPLLGVMGESR